MNNKLFVGNLSWNIDDKQLAEIFGEFGTVAEAVVIKDKFQGRSKGFGFVTMSSDEEAQKAIEGLNGKEVDGRAVNVSISNSEKRDSRKSYGGNSKYNDRDNN